MQQKPARSGLARGNEAHPPSHRSLAMTPLGNTPAAAASPNTGPPGSVQSAASIVVQRKAIDLQAAAVVQLISALPLPQPALATSGSIGTRVNSVV